MPFTQTNNYSLSGVQPSDGDRIDSRVDHVFSDRWRSFVRYSYSNESSLPFNSFGNPASSSGGDGPTYTKTHSLSIDHNYSFGPTWVLNVRYGLNRRLVDRLPLSAGFDLAAWGSRRASSMSPMPSSFRASTCRTSSRLARPRSPT